MATCNCVYNDNLYIVGLKMPASPVDILYTGNDKTKASSIFEVSRKLLIRLSVSQDCLFYTQAPTRVEWQQQEAQVSSNKEL